MSDKGGAIAAAGMSVEKARRALARAFAGGGSGSPALDARLLAMEACGLSHTELIVRGEQPLAAPQAARLNALAFRRLSGEPVSRIVGVREFWGLQFRLAPETLDPRPDTETLVQAALDAARARAGEPLRILDLGTGTGCILTALLHELPAAYGLGVDISAEALAVARENASRLGVGRRAGFVRADWLAGIGRHFDIVVANPPYVARGMIAGLSCEVRAHDPLGALDGGADGLDAYRAIVPGLGGVLRPGGIAFLEVGLGQAGAVSAMVARSGLRAHIDEAHDLAGIARVVVARTGIAADKEKKQLESWTIRASLS